MFLTHSSFLVFRPYFLCLNSLPIQIGLWGFSFTAWQAPYALVVLDVLMGQSIWDNLMGIATGHLYHFIR